MKLVAYVFANPTRQTYIHFDVMGVCKHCGLLLSGHCIFS